MQVFGAVSASLLCLLLACTAVMAGPTSTFGSSEAAGVSSFLLENQRDSGVFGGAEATFMSIETLQALGKDIPKTKKACKKLKEASERLADDIVPTYHIAASRVALGCLDEVSESVLATIKEAVENDLLENVCFGVKTAALVHKKKSMSLKELGLDVSKVLSFLSSLVGTSGLASDIEGGKTSLGYSLMVGEALLAIKDLDMDMSDRDMVSTIAKRLSKVTNAANRLGKSMYFPATSDLTTLASTSYMATVLLKLGVMDNADKVSDIAAFMVKSKSTRSVQDIHALVLCLKAMSGKEAKDLAPVVLNLSADGKVAVTDVIGESISEVSVSLESARTDAGEVVLSNQALSRTGDSSNKNTFQVPVSDLALGFNKLSFGISVNGNEVRAVRWFKKDGKAPASVKATLTVGDDVSAPVTYPKPLPSSPAFVADTTMNIVLALNFGDDAIPTQAFLQFTHEESGEMATFAAKKGTVKVNMSLLRVQKLFAGNGKYDMSVVIGDVLYSGFQWNLGSISITFPEDHTKEGEEPQMYSTPFKMDPPTAGLPEHDITHPEPEKQPLAILSIIFTFLVPAPFVLFLLSVPSFIGLNLRFPKGMGFVWTWVFQGLFGLLLLTIVNYWIGTTIFSAGAGISVIALGMMFTGNLALRAHGQMEDEIEVELKNKEAKEAKSD